MKKVTYLNHSFDVPDTCNFIAADLNGDVWAYENPPWWHSGLDRYECEEGGVLKVGTIAELKPPVLTI